MSHTTIPTRRKALQLLAGVPMLPIGASATVSMLATACGGSGGDDSGAGVAPSFRSAEFIGAPAFTTASAPAQFATTTVGSKLKVTLSDGSSQTYDLGYQSFFETGKAVPNGKGGTIVAGGYFDSKNQPIMDNSVPGKERQHFSESPDGTSFLTVPGAKVDGVKGNTVFAVVQFEYSSYTQAGREAIAAIDVPYNDAGYAAKYGAVPSVYGQMPSPIAVLTLDQDPATGKLSLVKYHNVDTSGVKGLWITCGASLSPWNTHLSSEEYYPDAFDQIGSAMSMLEGFSTKYFGDAKAANPYDYGHLPEVTVNADGTGSIQKHFNLGRYSRELVQVMPDNRTVLGGDDYTNGGLFLFVADKEKDLSSGTLYVAKYTSLLSETTTGKIQWIKLGSGSHAEIQALARDAGLTAVATNDGIKENGIFASTTTDPQDASFTKVKLAKKDVWVKLKAGQEKAAAFLETHRYAALKGASLAFTKNEGTTLNIQDKVAYSAYANVQDSMVEGGSGYVAENNVKFKKLVAGIVMQHKLAGGQKDDTGAAINSDWVPTESSVLLAGADIAPDALGNTAAMDKIASPDNLKFSEKLRTLFIGEDSGNHLNNYLWAYNLDTKKLERLLSTPAGAESTGLHAVDEINGWTYVASNFQHPGDEWYRFAKIDAGLQAKIDSAIDKAYGDKFSASVGYLTVTPKLG